MLATNLGRPQEKVRIVALADLDVDEVDMLTVVVVGSSNTRAFTSGEGRRFATRRVLCRQAWHFDCGNPMTVHFIGAGPGAADLITLRGLRLIERCPVCLYAGSLVPEEIVKAAPEGARVLDTAPMDLGEIIAEMQAAHARGQDVARVHSATRRSTARRPSRCAGSTRSAFPST